MALRAVAEVNLAAIERNAELLRGPARRTHSCARWSRQTATDTARCRSPARRCAAARPSLAVATAGEAGELRRAGLDAPILVLGAISDEELPDGGRRRTPSSTAWDQRFVGTACGCRRAVRAPDRRARQARYRPGAARHARPASRRLPSCTRCVAAAPALRAGRRDDALRHRRRRPGVRRPAAEAFGPFVGARRARSATERLVVHAANSAAILRVPASALRHGARRDRALRRRPDEQRSRRPRARAGARAAHVRRGGQADRRRGRAPATGGTSSPSDDSHIATLPIGYGDGVARALANNCDVLIGGRRYPLRGMVSMDNITVDVGSEPGVAVGDRATLIGVDGDERQTAEDLARPDRDDQL